MQIKNPPVEISPALRMLGNNEFPLFLWSSGGESALFEAGVSAMGPLLEQQMADLGLDPAAVKQIILTHGHPDHVMAAPMLRQLFPGATVSASAIAAATLSNEKAIGFFKKVDQGFVQSLLKAGSIEESHRCEPFADTQIPVDRTLAEGDAVTVGDTSFQVLETPGHSPCSLSFYEPGEKVLIISDATGYYLPDLDCWWPNYFSGYGAYVESMRRLAKFDAGTLCLSHNAVIQGADAVKVYFRRAIAATEAYHRRIIDDFKAGQSASALTAKLGAEVFEMTTLLPLEFFQKNCGILVKESLKHEGLDAETN